MPREHSLMGISEKEVPVSYITANACMASGYGIWGIIEGKKITAVTAAWKDFLRENSYISLSIIAL